MNLRSVSTYLSLIKFSHTIFALPFALIGVMLALRNMPVVELNLPKWQIFGWVILAMAGARSGAMGFNRLIDRKWDADNPRTANRPSVTGEISVTQMVIMIIISFTLLIYAAWNLNPLVFKLSPVAIFLVCFYSYCKRFTSLAHIFLGIAIGAAPVAAWIAVSGSLETSALILGASVMTWIAGFDVLYALQDYEFDKDSKLKSIPVRFGILGSLWISGGLHILTVIFWVILARLEALNWIFYLGIGLCSSLLIWEHLIVTKDDLSKINIAFMNMNSWISVTLFVALLFDLVLL
ncbi:MAG: UbiA family prenyltransferase [Proteobacteria bacterium]|nr:UbiA family prenyltransferase [Pseudomonadota bacterium]